MTEIRVVFPQPDGPMSIRSSPRATSRSMPRSACTALSPRPYVLVTPRQETARVGWVAIIAWSSLRRVIP
ncbi:MAG: hypothetical protein U0575_16380 [Phycisphaerales bacterium]